MSNTTLIKNATIVNEGQTVESDLLIRDQRIDRIGSSLSVDANRIIDADGMILMPGMIDDQVHFREPGLIHKGCIHTESRAAAVGGITSVMEMPNTSPPTTSLEALESKFDIAAQNCATNYSFYLGASNDNLDEIKRLDVNQACGIKIFMGASTGNMLVDNPDTLEAIFREAKVIIATHCEDTPSIEANLKTAMEQYGADNIPPAAHIQIRDHQACLKSSALAVSLARKHGSLLHVLHLTTADELDQFQAGDIAGKQITAEACVHHLFFSEPDYQTHGNLIKCNPAIKTEQDRKALINAINSDRIDIIATDHAPHLLNEKETRYLSSAAGLPLVQDAVGVLLELNHRNELSLPTIVRKTAHNVADRFRIVDRGYIREGYYADLILVDPLEQWTPQRDDVLSRCGWSPFEQSVFHGRVKMTLINGHAVFENGQLDESFHGMRLEFDRK